MFEFNKIFGFFSDCYKAKALISVQNTYVDKLGLITLAQVMQHGCVIKVCQVGHIISLLILGRIDLTDKVFLEVLALIIVNNSAKEKEKFAINN